MLGYLDERPLAKNALVACGILGVALLSFLLSIRHFGPELNSDHLYPHMFVKDLLEGAYPPDAWKFGSATFLFPDYLSYGLIYTFVGDSGVSFPVFAVFNYLCICFSIAWLAAQLLDLKCRDSLALASVSVGSLLLFQFLGKHGFQLYWIGLPGFHGSIYPLGFFLLGWLVRAARRQRIGKRAASAIVIGGFLGVFSNTLMLTQILGPFALLVGLYAWKGRIRWKFAIRLIVLCLLAPLVLALLLRAILELNNIWDHARVFREYPAPSEIWNVFMRFIRDFPGETWSRIFAFWLLFAGLIVLSAKRFGQSDWLTGFLYFCVISLLISIALPIFARYWKDFLNTRYFLNLVLFPGVALSFYAYWRFAFAKRYLPWLALVPFAVGAVSVPLEFEREKCQFPYPEAVAEFDTLVEGANLSLGLSHYWDSHHINQLSRSEVTLNHIREDGRPYFWCNNVYWYYDYDNGSDALSFPRYQFILVNRLDEATIRAVYGEPDSVLVGHHNRLFLYDDGASIEEYLDPLLREYLIGKSLRIE